jgi:hypothetical protein
VSVCVLCRFLIQCHPEALGHHKLAAPEGVKKNLELGIFALNRPLLKLNSEHILFNAIF